MMVVSDRTEVIAVPSVLAGSVPCACSCQSRQAWLHLSSPHSLWGHDRVEVVRLSSAIRLRQEEGVVVDPSLSVRPSSRGLARPRSYGP
jgi:hypothetical protein